MVKPISDELNIAGKTLASRLMLGTSRYPSPAILQECIVAANPGFITVSIRRSSGGGNNFYDLISMMNVPLVPNTAGCRNADEAYTTATMARELLNSNWIKLEIIDDEETQCPNVIELLSAAKKLLANDFKVLAYCTEDLSVCSRLADLGCHAIMPWGSPIGSGQGLNYPQRLEQLRNRLYDQTLIIDAGIGKPSDAALALELGYDAVLLNTAVALAHKPIDMAAAFKLAVAAGRKAYKAGTIPAQNLAQPSTLAPDTPVEEYEIKKNYEKN